MNFAHPHDRHAVNPQAAPSLNATALRATLHCLSGCAVGEVLGMVIGTALGLSNSATIAVALALAFAFGYLFTMTPLLRAGLPLRQAGQLALAADSASIALMELVDNLIMVVVPGAMDAALSSLLFWGSLGRIARDRGRCRVSPEPLANRSRHGPCGGPCASRPLSRLNGDSGHSEADAEIQRLSCRSESVASSPAAAHPIRL